jgi:hypothetical protein
VEAIQAVVDRVAYTHSNNWRILVTDAGTIKGVVAWDIKEKDRIEARGEWGLNPRDGKREFDAKSIIPSIPTDPRALLHYAATKTIGLGEAKEQLIWDRFGDRWQEHPDLEGIPGIRETTRFAWVTTLQEIDNFAEQAQAMAYLLACGCSVNMASAAWEEWHTDTMGRVLANPYDMADLPHYGFLAVDKHRTGFGIADDDPRRMREAIVYAIKQEGEKGHTACALRDVVQAVKILVPYTDEDFDAGMRWLVEQGRIVHVVDGDAAFLILKDLWEYEKNIHERYS